MTTERPLLSIAIPAYGRPGELKKALDRFVEQISGKYEREIEILVSDDATPDDALREIRRYSEQHSFIRVRRYADNIGLERNLIACSDECRGEYLWIFGDDDYLESDQALDCIIPLLKKGDSDFIVLNRTRRSFDLSKLISDNWMRLPAGQIQEFKGLKEFCLAYGFISVIGFISVNIFRREKFQRVQAEKYMGTMYPQLGAMLEAFHGDRTLLIGDPLVCHRTQTSEEKRAALGKKLSEAAFMADVQTRNATYFSHPYVRMLAELLRLGAFTPSEIVRIPENTVINGLLIDFLIQSVEQSRKLGIPFGDHVWGQTELFFAALPLDSQRRTRVEALFLESDGQVRKSASGVAKAVAESLTVSVVSPSFNQAEFLRECLTSVKVQTYPVLEHLVYDPGSKDGSREVAAAYRHVTLFPEADSGQSDALNKGFARARGDIIAWVNSDDCFADPGVFARVIDRFSQPDQPDIVYGRGIYTDENGKKLRDVYVNTNPGSLNWRFQQEDGILQPALFMRRSVIERVGPLRNDLHYCMDYEYWIRCMKAGMTFAFVDDVFAVARYHSNNKTYGMRGKSYAEVCEMMKEHFGYVNHVWLMRYAEFLAEGHDGVLANATNVGIKDGKQLDQIYRELLRDYNSGHDTYTRIKEGSSKKGIGDTYREMNKLGITPAVPCHTIPLEQSVEPGCVCYTVGPRRWAYDAKWKAAQISRTHEFFRARILDRRSDVCVIVGNGPSLNKTDLSLLRGQDVIISNNAFLSKELLEFGTYFTTVNYLVAEQSSHQINRLKSMQKVLPYWMAYCLNPDESTYFVDAVGRPEFSTDIFKNMSWRHTVTFFNLHLAYGLGYKKVVMIGFDHTYKQPKGVLEQAIIHSYEEDENHFHPSYFRGKKWQAADVDMMEEMYALAKAAYDVDGRVIINATVGGNLELFPRMTLAEALADSPGRAEVALSDRTAPASILVGPYERDQQAHWDETDGVADLFVDALQGKTMIDVGAHTGTALAPFLERGWRIFGFEPDQNNRAKLLDRLASHANGSRVNVDTRCVGKESKQKVPFYSSSQSTGISGLSAFHASHVESQTVDIVSLSDFFADREVPEVDFLKIDTEGHDLFVLQGFPWNRARPAVIECEFEDAKTLALGYTFADLADYLVSQQYTVFVSEWHPIVKYGIRHQWNRLSRYPCKLSNDNAWGNLLAFRDPIPDEVLADAVRRALTLNKVPIVDSAAKAAVEMAAATAPVSNVAGKGREQAGESFEINASNQFVRLSKTRWRYLPDAAPQHLWQAIYRTDTACIGQAFVACLKVECDSDVDVLLSLCRHGRQAYEGNTSKHSLKAGIAQVIHIRHQFRGAHDAIRVQMEFIGAKSNVAMAIEVGFMAIVEAVPDLNARTGGEDFGIADANRLYRERRFTQALGLYLRLYRTRQHKMYLENAKMSAIKLELGDVNCLPKLAELLD